jgi:hypothetical protein
MIESPYCQERRIDVERLRGASPEERAAERDRLKVDLSEGDLCKEEHDRLVSLLSGDL